MPPLSPLPSPCETGNSACQNCSNLLKRIAVLEKRIDTLRAINEGEDFLRDVEASLSIDADANGTSRPTPDNDTVICGPLKAMSFGNKDLEDTIPWDPVTGPYPTRERVASTPRTSRLRLESDSIFPPLPPPGAAPLHPLRRKSTGKKRLQLLKNAARNRTTPRRGDATTVTSIQPPSSNNTPSPNREHPVLKKTIPKRLLIGDQNVSSISIPETITYSFANVTIAEIKRQIPLMLTEHPQIRTVIIHTGNNDVRRRQSSVFMTELKSLTRQINNEFNCHCVLSGTFPSPRDGSEIFSRIFGTHQFMETLAAQSGHGFVDNFDSFWKRPELFAYAGRINYRGTEIIKNNILQYLKQ